MVSGTSSRGRCKRRDVPGTVSQDINVSLVGASAPIVQWSAFRIVIRHTAGRSLPRSSPGGRPTRNRCWLKKAPSCRLNCDLLEPRHEILILETYDLGWIASGGAHLQHP